MSLRENQKAESNNKSGHNDLSELNLIEKQTDQHYRSLSCLSVSGLRKSDDSCEICPILGISLPAQTEAMERISLLSHSVDELLGFLRISYIIRRLEKCRCYLNYLHKNIFLFNLGNLKFLTKVMTEIYVVFIFPSLISKSY